MEYEDTEQAYLEECNLKRTKFAGKFFALICPETELEIRCEDL
jgi:hypothetical protein